MLSKFYETFYVEYLPKAYSFPLLDLPEYFQEVGFIRWDIKRGTLPEPSVPP